MPASRSYDRAAADIRPVTIDPGFQLFVDGKVDAAVDARYPLDQAGDALQYVKDGRVKGKVVLTTGRG